MIDRKEIHKYLQIRVKDTGIGMTYEETQKLFQKFHVVNSSRDLNKNGLGLGLYLSRQIWTLLGGSIFWESEKGYGTTFIIEFDLDPKSVIKNLLTSPCNETKRNLRQSFKKMFNKKNNLNLTKMYDRPDFYDDTLPEDSFKINIPYDFIKTNAKRLPIETLRVKHK